MTDTEANKVSIVVTGLAWMGGGIRSVESTIEDMLTNASDEIQVAAYMITGGAGEFLRLVQDCLHRGVRVTLIVNRLATQPEEIRTVIKDMARRFHHFVLLDFHPKDEQEYLHAKIMVADRSTALVGSPNLSWRGLVLNHELAVVITGPAAAKIGSLLDALGRDPRTSVVKV